MTTPPPSPMASAPAERAVAEEAQVEQRVVQAQLAAHEQHADAETQGQRADPAEASRRRPRAP